MRTCMYPSVALLDQQVMAFTGPLGTILYVCFFQTAVVILA